MKKVFLTLLIYISVLLLIAIIFERLFTDSHYKNVSRNPVDWVMSLDSTDVYDYLVLGSSRTLNTVDPFQIEVLTKKHGINLGLQDAKPFDLKLFVKRLIKKNITHTLYIQIDDSWNINEAGEKSTVNWLPYLNEEAIWKEFEKLDDKKYFYYKNIPFYKYAHYDSEIGIRDFCKGLTQQKLSTIKDRGFIPLYEVLKTSERDREYPFTLQDEFNIHIKEIITLCKENGVSVFFFTAPIYKADGNHSILLKYLPNYYDFTNLISDPEYFYAGRHLNAKGAKLFTEKLSLLFH